MSGAYSRRKGATAERELCSLLRDFLGVEASRNLKQYQQAQHGDIEQLIGPYLVEVKNCARLELGKWWEQARVAALSRRAAPCVAYRLPNRGQYDRWRFIVPLNEAWRTGCDWRDAFRYTADVGLEGFSLLVREHGGALANEGVKSG